MNLKRISVAILGLLLWGQANAQAPSKIQEGKYKLVWADEFDYVGLPDSSKWGYDIGGHGWGNHELEYYTNSEKNARVEAGKLVIEAHKEDYENSKYTSARLVTKNKGDWKYGRFEFRARLPEGRGTWPAIWMLPTDWEYGGWPASGEIDILEHVGFAADEVHGTVHTEAYNHGQGTQKGGSLFMADNATGFHEYVMEWDEEKIVWFIDGRKYFQFKNEHKTHKEWPFDKRFHLILNIAIGGGWGGQKGVDENIFPLRMEVDYVRVYASTESL